MSDVYYTDAAYDPATDPNIDGIVCTDLGGDVWGNQSGTPDLPEPSGAEVGLIVYPLDVTYHDQIPPDVHGEGFTGSLNASLIDDTGSALIFADAAIIAGEIDSSFEVDGGTFQAQTINIQNSDFDGTGASVSNGGTITAGSVEVGNFGTGVYADSGGSFTAQSIQFDGDGGFGIQVDGGTFLVESSVVDPGGIAVVGSGSATIDGDLDLGNTANGGAVKGNGTLKVTGNLANGSILVGDENEGFADDNGPGMVSIGGNVTDSSLSLIAGSDLTVSGDFDGSIELSSGSTAEIDGFLSAGADASQSGTVFVGDLSSLTVADTLDIGVLGTGFFSVIGGTVNANGGIREGVEAGSIASVVIGGTADAGGMVTVIGDYLIGVSGTSDDQVEGGAQVTIQGDLILGDNSGGQGSLTISGSGTAESVSGQIVIGADGIGSLAANSGAMLSSTYSAGSAITLGSDSGSMGTMTVSDSGTDLVFKSGTSVVVGNEGIGVLSIQNGATFESDSNDPNNDWAVDVGSNAGSDGTVTVDGQGSTLTAGSGGLSVGDAGQGSLTVSNGAFLNVSDKTYGLVIGTAAGSTGNVNITGAGSAVFLPDGPVIVGESGTGTLTVGSQASLKTFSDNGFMSIGSLAGSDGTVKVRDTGTTLNLAGALIVGDAGQGNLQVSNAGSVTAGSAIIGAQATGDGTMFVYGGSSFDAGTELVVGLAGYGALTIQSGSTFSYAGDTLVIGEEAGSLGNVSFLNETTTINFDGALIIGQDGGANFYLDSGISVTNSDVTIGENEGSTGLAKLGSENGLTDWTITGDVTAGVSGSGQLELKHGDTVTIAGTLVAGEEAGSTGIIELDGPGGQENQNASLTVSGAATIGEEGIASFSASRGSVATFMGGLTLAQGVESMVDMTIDASAQVNALFQQVTVGGEGSATIEITKDGMLNASGSDVVLGADLSGDGEIDVDGAYPNVIGEAYPSTVSEFDAQTLTVGGDGTGVLKVTNGGVVEISGALNEGDDSSIDVESGGSITIGGNWVIGDGASFSASGKNQGTKVQASGDLTTSAKGLFVLDDAGVSVDIGGDAKFVGTQLVNNTNELNISGSMTLSPAAGDTDMFTATDQGTLVVVGNDVTVGDGGTATLDVLAGASVSNGGALILGSQSGAQGTIDVSGDGSIWTAGTGDVTVGDAGNGTITVGQGATFDVSANDVTIAAQNGSVSSLAVSDDGSEFDAASMTVGGVGTAVVVLSDGGSLEVGDLTLGEEDGGDGTVTVADAESSLAVNGDLEVGSAGKGLLTVDGDSSVAGDTSIGSETGSSGHVTVNGATLELDGKTTVGESGTGMLLVQLAGTLTAGEVTLGENLGSSGTFTVDGTGTTAITEDLTIGSAGLGKLNVTGGAELTTTGNATFGEFVSANVQKGDIASDGYWNIFGGISVGDAGIATVTIESGGNVAVAGDAVLGDESAATGEIDVKGASADSSTPSGLSFGGPLTIGGSGTGTLKITAGGLVAPTPGGTGVIEIAAQSGSTGTVSVDGSSSELEGSTLAVGGTETAEGGTASLTISNQGLVDVNDVTLWNGGKISLAGGELATDMLTETGGKISGYGSIDGAITDDTTIMATGGTLSLSGDVSGTGRLVIDAGSTLDVAGVNNTIGVGFAAGSNETLGIDHPTSFLATISGFGSGDKIDLADIAYSGTDSAALLTDNVLQIGYSGGDYDLQLDPSHDYVGDIFQLAADASGNGSEITETVACYCRGTLLATRHGELPVEMLAIGDSLMTASGVHRPIKWIGKRSYGGRFIIGRHDILPICFKAGSLDDHVPRRALWISPHHAMYLQGVLIEARDLVNGVSIVQAEQVENVEYFHIELDSHDVILAEGALSETFVDDDSRGMFHNVKEYTVLYPSAERIAARYCAPRFGDGFEVEAVRERLALRAGLRSATPTISVGSLRGYVDRITSDVIEGWAQNEDHPEAPVCLDICAGGRLIGQVLANRYREDLESAGLGSGRHSFAFALPNELVVNPGPVEVRRSLDKAALPRSAPTKAIGASTAA